MPLNLPFEHDFKNANRTISDIFQLRVDRLAAINKRALTRKDTWPSLFRFYRHNIPQFITDWGCTLDPRNAEVGLPVLMPFLLFPKQEELLTWTFDRLRLRENGEVLKSRDVGASYVEVAGMSSCGLFIPGFSAGFTSYKEAKVDKIGDLDSLLEKGRVFLEYLPAEFTGGWDRYKHSRFGLICYPWTTSSITGEVGDDPGRGGRKTIFIVDEHASLAHPESVEKSLSQTSYCRINMSTPKGDSNVFANKWHSINSNKFEIGWEDDPRKDLAWYHAECKRIDDPIIIAQELDKSFTATIQNALIAKEWILAAVDAHIKLKIKPMGPRRGALDVADTGVDTNAFGCINEFLLEYVEEWYGDPTDPNKTGKKTFELCGLLDCDEVRYDSVGVGAGVKSTTSELNSHLPKLKQIDCIPFNGATEVIDKDEEVFPPAKGEKINHHHITRLNGDYYANRKAQEWFRLKRKFYRTYLAVTQGEPINRCDLISLSSKILNLPKVIRELGQPRAVLMISKKGEGSKYIVDKSPGASKSPNIADMVMIGYSKRDEEFWTEGVKNYAKHSIYS